MDALRLPIQNKLLTQQKSKEEKAIVLFEKSNPHSKAKKVLMEYSFEWSRESIQSCWKLGDDLWVQYDEKF